MKVDKNFQNALLEAVRRFINKKSPLSESHNEEINLVNLIINNENQTNRELRDGLQRICTEINWKFRHWFSGSLLVDYIREVLIDPRFNVELMYEEVIIGLEHQVEELTKKLPANFINMQQQLSDNKIVMLKISKQLEDSNALNKKLGEVIEKNQISYKQLSERHNNLYVKYINALNKLQSVNRNNSGSPLLPGVNNLPDDNEPHLFAANSS